MLARSTWFALVLVGCNAAGGVAPPADVGPTPGDTCGGIRLTHYTASNVGYCQWDRTLPFLPTFVRDGMTAAIAEPWLGGSYGGDPGAACGECWEIDSLTGSTLVMIHDLCPIAGNPICAGSFFHFDLADEAGAVLVGNGVSAASARRVACPVSGGVRVQVNDQNPGYVRLSFVNHRIPIARAFVRGAGPGVAIDNPWVPLEREGGAFVLVSMTTPLARGGDALEFRVESAQGEVLDFPTPVPTGATGGAVVDLGAQLTDRGQSPGPSCRFRAPSDVYVDGFGGIDAVRWRFNGWAPAVQADEVSVGCVAGTCLRVTGLAAWSGFHIYYVEPFATSSFTRVVLSARVASGGASVSFAPSRAGVTCTPTVVPLTDVAQSVSIDLASACAGQSELDAVTVQVQAGTTLILDDVRFEP